MTQQSDLNAELKRCSKCHIDKCRSEFNRDASKKDSLYPSCRQCYQEYYKHARERKLLYKKGYRERNKEKISKYRIWHYFENREHQIQQAALWAKENPLKRRANQAKRRSKIACSQDHYSASDVESLCMLQRKRCAVCKSKLNGMYHIDHVIPLSEGGSNGRENIQILCPQCNLSKKNIDPVAFMQKRGFLL